jgi:thiamine pyrophosphate-dependent acetolactate synthase large subunit-like protein
MVAIGGVVPLPDTLKQTHQSMDSVSVMKPVTQFSVAIDAPNAAGEPVVNAFRAAMAPRPGTCFIAFPRDVQSAATEAGVPPSLPLLPLGAAPADMIRKDAENSRRRQARQTALVPWPLQCHAPRFFGDLKQDRSVSIFAACSGLME